MGGGGAVQQNYQQQPQPSYGYQPQQPPPGFLSPQGGYGYPPAPLGGNLMLGDGMWRDGLKLVVYCEGVELPDRCVKCNAPANGFRLRRRMYWHSPGWYFLILIHLFVYIIASLFIRKSATVYIGLCEEHRSKRRTMLITGWLLFAAGVLGFILAGAVSDGTPAAIGAFLFLAGIIVLIIASRIVAPSKIDDTYAWIKGVHRDFLLQLPQWPGWS